MTPSGRIPTQLPCLDRMLGGGLRYGALLTVYGAPGVGKTALALRLCAAAQRTGEVAFLDADCGLSRQRITSQGVSPRRLWYGTPTRAMLPRLLLALTSRPALSLVVVDVAEGWPGRGALYGLRRQLIHSGTAVAFFLSQHPRRIDALAFASHHRLWLRYGHRSADGHGVDLGVLGGPSVTRLWLSYTSGRLG